MDEKTKKPSANIEYEIVNVTTKKPIVKTAESTAQFGNVGEQITLQKSLSLAGVEPGLYQITIKVDDNISKQEITPTAKFTVE
jgi:hypothetical protein